MYIRRFLPFFYREPAGDGDTAGAPPAADPPAPDTGGEGGDTPTAPTSTLDAVNAALADVAEAAAPKAPAAPAEPPAASAPPAAGTPPADPNATPAAAAPTPPAPPPPAPGTPPTDDELCAPLEGLKGRTKERFENLAGRLKERSTELETVKAKVAEYEAFAPQAEQATATLREIHGAMQEAQVTGDDFAGFLAYAKQIRTGNYAEAAQTLIKQLRPLLPYVDGKVDIGGLLDPMAEFPDLQQAVTNLEITAGHAKELANARRLRQQTEQQTQQAQQTQQQTAQQQRERNDGLTSLSQLEQQLATSDADYRRIAPELVKMIPEITRTYPPGLWSARVREQYMLLKQYLPTQQQQGAGAPPPVAPPNPQPLRPGSNGAALPAKMSTMDIVNMATSGELT